MSIRKTTPILGAAAVAALAVLSVPANAAPHATTKNVVLAAHHKAVYRGGYAYPTRYCLPRSQAGFWGKGACR